MSTLLLTGAGFSRYWGGWLAKEVFEYLIGEEGLTSRLRALLWEHREEGFEAALNYLQLSNKPEHNEDLRILTECLASMFDKMNDGYARTTRGLQVVPWLASFGAIFTLNQDTLVERLFRQSYTGDNPLILPGVRSSVRGSVEFANPDESQAEQPELIGEQVPQAALPYFKLHGSSELEGQAGTLRQMLIVGGRKPQAISNSPLLTWYFDEFARRLREPAARLVVVGYSFRDDHVNELIVAAVPLGLRLFIIDPMGHEVLTLPLLEVLRDALAGASRRELASILGGDNVELQKLERFSGMTFKRRLE